MTRSSLMFLPLLPILFLACDEELPPQNNPLDLFAASSSVQYNYISDTRPTQSSFDIFIVYKNHFDETLNDFAAMKGTIKIEWLASPEERGSIIPFRTDQLTMDNLFYAPGYDFSSNRIAIDPGDSIILRYRWNLKTDDSTTLMGQVKYASDRTCPIHVCGGDIGFRAVSSRQQFQLSSTFTVFQRSGVITMTPVNFSACWIQPNCGEVGPCNQPNPDNPCNISR
ncbi:MAG: hypothetical protein M0R68_06415 [Bacteroidetes bacterium]|nr:hypothetical protein [Bacteroidota bacterium]